MSCSFRTVVLTAALTVALVFHSAAAADIVVGGQSGGWDLGIDYGTWASSQTFTTGDNLIFQYTVGQHDVLEVTKANYDSCGTSGPINTFATGNDNIALSSAGTRYFICGIPGHCDAGMKLAVTTTAGSSGTPAAASPPPPTTTTPSSPTPPTTTTPSPSTNPIPGDQAPPPNSGANKVVSSFGLVAVLFALVV